MSETAEVTSAFETNITEQTSKPFYRRSTKHPGCRSIECRKDPKFEAWDEEDLKVMSKLWNNLVPNINDTLQILGKGDLPSLKETIALLRAEEGRCDVMIETLGTLSSALVTKNSNLKAHVSQTQPDGEGNPQEQAELNREEVGKLRNLLGTLEKPRAIGLRFEEEDWMC
ncbi:hypothetical protein CK203_029894 [Vitis vinifera]|uniref:Uncharacterized protein n=1 Tax=Vitis vinifera TaxID=29760 RepID=A0A438IDE2_VITVI|nr:hypothetical protein CK203_029894 [Vitis vinifera]